MKKNKIVFIGTLVLLLSSIFLCGCFDKNSLKGVIRIEGRLNYDMKPDFDFKTYDFIIQDKKIIRDITKLIIVASDFPKGTKILHFKARAELKCYDKNGTEVICPLIYIFSEHGTVIEGETCGVPNVNSGYGKSDELGEYLTNYFKEAAYIYIK